MAETAEAKAERIVSAIDANHDGDLSRSELISFFDQLKSVLGDDAPDRDSATEAEELLSEFGDGVSIKCSKFKEFLTQFCDQEPERVEIIIAGLEQLAPLTASYGTDQLYYGSIPVHLVPVPGSTVVYDHGEWEDLTSDEDVARVVSRADPIGEDSTVVVPAIPALDFGLKPGVDVRTPDAWPEYMRQPLLKVPEPVEGEPLAFASGVRSCTFKIGDNWYRLKGSGNNDQGFIVKQETYKRDGEEVFTRTIRGSAFMHTSMRENNMTARLAAASEPQGILGANIAMGAYEYGPPNQPFGDGPEMPPACIVEGTRGDRRLGSHVFASLELLMPLLVDADSVDLAGIVGRFPEFRRGEDGGVSVDTAAFMSDHMLGVEMAASGFMPAETQGLSFEAPRDHSTLVDGTATALPMKWLDPNHFPDQWTTEANKPMEPEWRALWSATVNEYNRLLDLTAENGLSESNVLGYLFNRLGNDCGRIIRCMHDDRVSWGTYQDAMCFDGQWHCNAHANNVVILDEKFAPEDMFLGYLDLDMAFDDKSFVSVYGKNAPTGTVGIPADEHDVLLRRENVNFMEVLAGGDSNNGVPSVAKHVIKEHPTSIQAVKAVLYDSLVHGYMRAYNCDENMVLAAHDANLHQVARQLIKLAIIIMADFVA